MPTHWKSNYDAGVTTAPWLMHFAGSSAFSMVAQKVPIHLQSVNRIDTLKHFGSDSV